MLDRFLDDGKRGYCEKCRMADQSPDCSLCDWRPPKVSRIGADAWSLFLATLTQWVITPKTQFSGDIYRLPYSELKTTADIIGVDIKEGFNFQLFQSIESEYIKRLTLRKS